MHDVIDSILSADARNLRPSPIRAFAALINDPAIISFAGGVPSPHTFPSDLLAEIAARVVRESKVTSLQYGATPGLPALRAAIAGVCSERGIATEAADVVVTTGSQQGLDLLARTLLDPGDVVLVELPTYIGAAASFYARRAELAGVEQDDDGIVPASLDAVATRLRAAGRRVRFLYTIPNFQNPSGRLMKQRRREEVLAIAARHDLMIVEDDPYGDLVFDEGCDTRPIAARDRDAIVVYLGSFSKVLAPGLRCGWVRAPRPLLKVVETAKEAADLCSGMLDQSIVEAFLSSGELPNQLARVRAYYRDRRTTLMDALERHLGGKAVWTKSAGGLFTFLTLLDGRDTAGLVRPAIDAGVAFIPGGPFFVDGSGRSTMRLTFAKEPDDRMQEGVGRLARVLFP